MGILKSKIKQAAEKRIYTKEEIKNIESKILLREEGIGLEKNFIEDEYTTRQNAYCKMLKTVEAKLDKDEEIVISKINVPYKNGTAGTSITVYYQGLFFTNKRIFIFNMNFRYEEIEKLKIKNIEDISCLKELENLDGVRIEFKNKDRIFIKSYSNDEREITIIIVKHLLENGVEIQ